MSEGKGREAPRYVFGLSTDLRRKLAALATMEGASLAEIVRRLVVAARPEDVRQPVEGTARKVRTAGWG